MGPKTYSHDYSVSRLLHQASLGYSRGHSVPCGQVRIICDSVVMDMDEHRPMLSWGCCF